MILSESRTLDWIVQAGKDNNRMGFVVALYKFAQSGAVLNARVKYYFGRRNMCCPIRRSTGAVGQHICRFANEEWRGLLF